MMKHAKRSLEMQEDPMAEQTLLTIHLLIAWSHLLLDPSQEALGIILQDSNYGKGYSPIQTYFDYLERLDKRISVAVRHRAARNPGKTKEPKDPNNQGNHGGYQSRNLRGAYDNGNKNSRK